MGGVAAAPRAVLNSVHCIPATDPLGDSMRVEVRFDGDNARLSLVQMAQDIKKPSGDAT